MFSFTSIFSTSADTTEHIKEKSARNYIGTGFLKLLLELRRRYANPAFV